MKRALTILSLITWSISAYSQCSGFQIVASKSSICAPDIVRFQLLNPVPGSTYQWDVGQGNVTGADTLYAFYTAGTTVDAKVTITLPSGSVCVVTKNAIVQVNEKPEPQFEASRYLLCHGPGQVTFTDLTPNSAQRNWVIDGTNYPLTADSVVHNFVTTGLKSVSLIVVDSNGCQGVAQFIDTIEVLPELELDFSASVRRGCAPKTVDFNVSKDPATPYAKTYFWFFSGTSPDRSKGKGTQTRTYNSRGKYDVRLEIRLNNGCRYVKSKFDFLHFGDSVDLKLQTKNAIACNSVPVEFELLNDNLIGKIDWEFSGININIDSIDQRHRLGHVVDTGLLQVDLTYVEYGCTSTLAKSVFIDRDSVIAAFNSPDHFHCDVPHTVHWFDASNKGSANSLTYQWDITQGDSSVYSSTAKNDSFTFTEFLNSYDVRLIVEGDNGCKDTMFKSSWIYQDTMKLKFLPIPDIGCVGQTIFFQNNTRPTSYLSPDEFEWIFYALDDSTILDTSTEHSPEMIYWDTGYYNVTLIGQNGIGCKDTLEKIDAVYIMDPNLDYFIEDTNICLGDSSMLIGRSTPSNVNFTNHFDFYHNDSLFEYEGDTVFAKPNLPGEYEFIYSFDIEGGCVRRDTGVFKVNYLEAELLIDTLVNCTPFRFSHELDVLSNYYGPGTDSSLNYSWYVDTAAGWTSGNLNSSEPGIVFTAEGKYQVGLVLENSNACIDSLLSDTLEAGLNAQFRMKNDRLCVGDTLWLEYESRDTNMQLEWSLLGGQSFELLKVDYFNYGIVVQDSGQYDLQLKSFKPSQCSVTSVQPFEVIQVIAEFSSNDTFLQCAPVYVQFQSHSINADSLIWDFGDGTSNTTTLTSAGTIYTKNTAQNDGYDISLVAKNILGCTDTAIKLDYVVVRGPVPEFELSNHVGCEPLKVSFTNKSVDAIRTYLNYNDGSDLDSTGFSDHTYYNTSSQLVQKIHPSLFVFDSLGCGAIYTSEEPVVIYKKPNAGMIAAVEDGCLPFKVWMEDSSSNITSSQWLIHGDSISNNRIDSFVQYDAGLYSLDLIVSNVHRCKDTASQELYFKGLPEASIRLVDSPCLGKTTNFEAIHNFNQFVDTQGVQYHWEVEEEAGTMQLGFNQTSIVFRFDQPGAKVVRFITVLQDGCADTALSSIYIREQSEIDQPRIHVVSFISNYELEILHTEQNDPRFKSYLYEFSDQLKYSNSIAQDTLESRVFNRRPDSSLCVDLRINDFCDLLGEPFASHCFIHLRTSSPSPYENHLDWTHYVGWDSIAYYRVLRLNGTDTIEIAKLNSDINHFVDSPLCNLEYGYIIEAVDPEWDFRSRSFMQVQRPFYPQLDYFSDIENVTVERHNEILIYWDPSVSDRFDQYELIKYDQQSTEIERWLTTDTFYRDFNAQTSEESYIYRVQERDICEETNLKGREGKSILLTADYTSFSQIDWTAYRQWTNGVISYTVELIDPGFIEELGTTPSEQLSYQDHEHHPDVHDAYCYRVYAINDKGDTSKSNIACVKGPPLAFVPNAFSPNADGINESFRPITTFMKDGEINGLESYYFSIYNRWGEKLFETNDLRQAWDGNYKGKPCQQDVYIFEIQCLGVDNVQYNFKGNVTLLR